MPAAPTSISAHCGALPDPRVERTKGHLLLAILTIGLCAVRCGGEGWTAMATFGRAREPWLRTFLALPHGIPSHDTFGRVFAALDPDAFGAAFIAWVRAVAPPTAGQVVAIDGKTLRRTHDRARGRAAVHLVSAWDDASGLVLGQVAVDDKANEIVAIPQLLALLDVRGGTVTIDAMGCQTAVARQIVAQGGDLCAGAAGQPAHAARRRARRLRRGPRDRLRGPRPRAPQRRQDSREGSRAAGDPARLGHHRPGAPRRLRRGRAPGGTQRDRAARAERRSGDQRSGEVRHYLLSAPLDAVTFGRIVRRHWGIENRRHWVRDVTCNEDARRIRAGHVARNLACVGRLEYPFESSGSLT